MRIELTIPGVPVVLKKTITKAELDAAVSASPFRCPGGPGCQCCHAPGGCDCGCRDACPVFRHQVANILRARQLAGASD